MRYQEWLCGKWARNWQRKQQCVLMVWNLLGKRRTTVPHYWGWLNPTIQTWLPSHKLNVITVRISWFFWYTFTHLITLLNNTVNLATDANEPLEQKFIYKHLLEDIVNKDTQLILSSLSGLWLSTRRSLLIEYSLFHQLKKHNTTVFELLARHLPKANAQIIHARAYM